MSFEIAILSDLIQWTIHWAKTPYGALALFALAFVESSFFPIPPDPLLIALCLGATGRALRFAAVATTASVVGGLLGYAIGAGKASVIMLSDGEPELMYLFADFRCIGIDEVREAAKSLASGRAA